MGSEPEPSNHFLFGGSQERIERGRSCSVAPFSPLFLVAAPLKNGLPQFFSRVTEQLRGSGQPSTSSGAPLCSASARGSSPTSQAEAEFQLFFAKVGFPFEPAEATERWTHGFDLFGSASVHRKG